MQSGETALWTRRYPCKPFLRGERKYLHRLFQLQSTTAHISDIMAPYFHVCIFVYHIAGLVAFFLTTYTMPAMMSAFARSPALCQAVLAKILIQSNFHLTSPLLHNSCCQGRRIQPKAGAQFVHRSMRQPVVRHGDMPIRRVAAALQQRGRQMLTPIPPPRTPSSANRMLR